MCISAAARVLVLAAHPDDAEISVGGTIARLKHRNADVAVVHFSMPPRPFADAERIRQSTVKAAAILGYRLIRLDEDEHARIENIPDHKLVSLIDTIVEVQRPDIILSPWIGDSHGDHVKLARATVASSRRWKAQLYAYSPADYRTLRFHEFQPNMFVEITPFVEKKKQAVRAYKYDSQPNSVLDDENLERLWSYYGALSGFKYAEGLLLLRSRWPMP